MSVIFLVLPLALVLGAGFLIAFLWATRQGQFDDLETPAIRLALEDDARIPGSRSDSSEPGPPAA
ncbi:MAG: cbb3-type cytochrome oxidase assembly protein CcoS [Planctomycetota bacterium]|jgi:cbb3-type cytochrome oxidase maturation protein